VVCGTHLFGLQISTGNFEMGLLGRNDKKLTVTWFSLVWCRKAFHDLGAQYVTEFGSV
jgi:hypothetical protein